jgi:hypothetical protein
MTNATRTDTPPLGTCEHPQHPRTPHIRDWWNHRCIDWLPAPTAEPEES